MTHDQGGLQRSLGSLDFIDPILIIPHFIDRQLFSYAVVGTIILSNFGRSNDIFGEHVDWGCYFLEQMTHPDNFSDLERHVTHNRRGFGFILAKDSLNIVQFSGIVVKNAVVFGTEVVTQSLTFDGVFEFFEQLKRIFDITELSEICVDEIL